jgi:hypothetical protein
VPQIIRTIDEIMAARRTDTFFVSFPGLLLGDDPQSEQSRQMHIDWFEAEGISYETAAPRGWMSGDSGIYAVYVGPDDPRVARYSTLFENTEGKSLDPDVYQMVLLPYRAWLEGAVRRHRN